MLSTLGISMKIKHIIDKSTLYSAFKYGDFHDCQKVFSKAVVLNVGCRLESSGGDFKSPNTLLHL